MKRIAFIFFSCLLAVAVQANDLVGKWNFEAPDAPIGFQNGTVEFKKIDNKPCAEINFGLYSMIVDVKETSTDLYNTQVPILEGNIDVTLDNTEGEMKTIVNAMGMEIDVKLTAIKK